jgi:transcriptional regulator with XRE-family HTH domain
MSVRLRAEVFRHELAIRGISQAELARAAGLSEASVSAAARGLPVAPRTLRRIGMALAKAPVLELRGLVDGSVPAAGRPISIAEVSNDQRSGTRVETADGTK